jgi:hypothetical protein
MTIITKALLTFKSLSSSEKIIFGNHAIASLTAAALLTPNPFKNLLITVDELQALNDALTIAANGMINGGRAASAALKEARVAWNDGFTIAANGVSDAAQNVPSIIVAGGFIPTKFSRSATPLPGSIDDYTANPTGKNGNIIARTKKGASDASNYVTAALPPGATISFQQDTMIITVNGLNIYIAAHTTREIELYSLSIATSYTLNTYGFNTRGSGPSASVQVKPI